MERTHSDVLYRSNRSSRKEEIQRNGRDEIFEGIKSKTIPKLIGKKKKKNHSPNTGSTRQRINTNLFLSSRYSKTVKHQRQSTSEPTKAKKPDYLNITGYEDRKLVNKKTGHRGQ